MLVKKPKIEKLNKVEMLTLTPDRLSVKLGLAVNNPNFYALRIEEADFDIYNLKAVQVGTGELEESVRIGSRSSGNVNLILYLDTRKAVKTVDTDKRKLGIIIHGRAKAKALIFSRTQIINQRYEISIEDYIQKWIPNLTMANKEFFRITNTEVESNNTETRIRVHFEMSNPYGLDYELKAFPAQIFINDIHAGEGKLDAPVIMTEETETQSGIMTFTLQNASSLSSLGRSLLTGELSYEVRGDIHYSVFGVELQNEFKFGDKLNIDPGSLLRGLFRTR